MTKFHQHDCEQCRYIGSGIYQGADVDIYESCQNSMEQYIMRFGRDGDYITIGGDRATDSYNFCARMNADPNTMLATLRESRRDALRDANALREQLVKIAHDLDTYTDRIDRLELKIANSLAD